MIRFCDKNILKYVLQITRKKHQQKLIEKDKYWQQEM